MTRKGSYDNIPVVFARVTLSGRSAQAVQAIAAETGETHAQVVWGLAMRVLDSPGHQVDTVRLRVETLLDAGLTPQQIARQLNLTPNRVRVIRARIERDRNAA